MKHRIPAAAYHEAGHALAAVVLGMRVTVASIEAKGSPPAWRLRGGVIASFDHEGAKSRRDAERAATAGLAGEQAELLWSQEKPWRRQKSSRDASFSGDRAYVESTLQPFIKNSADKRRTIRRLKITSRTLLMKRWTSVEALAAKLAQRKALSGAEVKRLIAQTS